MNVHILRHDLLLYSSLHKSIIVKCNVIVRTNIPIDISYMSHKLYQSMTYKIAFFLYTGFKWEIFVEILDFNIKLRNT